MPAQSTAERLLASLHILLSGAMPPGAKVLRNAILPEKVPAAGVVILRDGDPGPPEVWLNIYARDAESFRASRAQVASDIARAVAYGRRSGNPPRK